MLSCKRFPAYKNFPSGEMRTSEVKLVPVKPGGGWNIAALDVTRLLPCHSQTESALILPLATNTANVYCDGKRNDEDRRRAARQPSCPQWDLAYRC